MLLNKSGVQLPIIKHRHKTSVGGEGKGLYQDAAQFRGREHSLTPGQSHTDKTQMHPGTRNSVQKSCSILICKLRLLSRRLSGFSLFPWSLCIWGQCHHCHAAACHSSVLGLLSPAAGSHAGTRSAGLKAISALGAIRHFRPQICVGILKEEMQPASALTPFKSSCLKFPQSSSGQVLWKCATFPASPISFQARLAGQHLPLLPC